MDMTEQAYEQQVFQQYDRLKRMLPKEWKEAERGGRLLTLLRDLAERAVAEHWADAQAKGALLAVLAERERGVRGPSHDPAGDEEWPEYIDG